MPERRTMPVALLVVLAGAAWALADDDVDLQVRGNEKVDGTLRPADEGERFLVDAPRGARVTASVKRTGTGGPTPVLQVLDPASAVVATGTTTPTGAKLSKFAFPASALYRLRVAGDGVKDGDYRFTVKVTPTASWPLKTGPEVAAGGETTFAFAAPAGALADVSLTPAAHSAFAPRIVDVEGPGGFVLPVDGAGATPRRHVARRLQLGRTGEYAVRLRNDGAAAGAFAIVVRLTTPRIARVAVDIRDTALSGAFGGDSQVFGRVVDATGGLIDPATVGGVLSGSSVNVGTNSVPSTSVIAISASDTFFVDDANHPAGVAITLTPAGTTFAKPVTVTVPYDPQAFDDPVTELTIYIQNATTGALEAVPQNQLVFDTSAATVSFPTSHFSRFQGTSKKDRPLKGRFLQLELGGAPLPAFGGLVVFGLSPVDGLKGPRTGNGLSRTIDRRSISFDATTIGHSPSQSTQDGGVIQIPSDDVVNMISSLEGPIHLVRGRNPDVLIQPPSQSAPGASLSVLLRVAKGAATYANLAGDWNVVVLEVGAAHDTAGAVVLHTTGQRGRVTIGLDGSVKASKFFTESASAGTAGTWMVSQSKAPPGDGTLQVAPGRILFGMPLGTSPLIKSMQLEAVLKGDVLVGIADGVVGPDKSAAAAVLRLVLLVRVPKSATPSLLAGRALYSSFGVLPTNRAGAVQDLGYGGDDLVVGHDGVRSTTLLGSRLTLGHDASGAAQATPSAVNQPGTYGVTADGLYHESAPLAFGAVAPRGGFYVSTKFNGPVFAIGFGVVAPPKP